MFRTKKDVDKHCQEVLKKFQTEKDRNLRCLSIAQQYYNVRDYESAKRYVTLYLSVKDNSSIAHKLLAQCHEFFGEKEKALKEYKYSIQLDPKQPELVLKVCELLADNSIFVDKNQAKYWHEKGESQFPYHPTVFKLKQKIFSLGEEKSSESAEFGIIDELKNRPSDPLLHIQLLTLYIENGRIRDAYEKAFGKSTTFVPNVQWYQCGVKICKLYKTQFPCSLNEEFYANYLLVLERTLALSVPDVKISRKSIPECISFLARLDEVLSEATSLMNKTERFLLLIKHMCGQLCFHTANILYRKIKWEDNNWQEINSLIAPLLLLSTAAEFNIKEVKSEGSFSNILKQCIQHSVYRISQAGFVLLSLAKNSQKYFIEKIFHSCVANYWKERICEKIYSTSEYKTFSKSSFFMNYAAFSNLPSELPKNLLENIDQFLYVVETIQPSSLHHLVWLGVQYLFASNKESICEIVLPLKFSIKTLNSLQFSENNATSSYAESLCKLDVDAFLYACVYCAKSSWTQHTEPNRLQTSSVFPSDVSRLLCSPEHEQWWEFVYQMVNQNIPEDNFSRVRSVIQRGIETVRLVGNNHMPLQLLVLLGRTFANKATIESDSDSASALESRALLYWKAALPTLEKIVRDDCYSSHSKSMFEYFGKISKTEAAKLISEGNRYVGMQLVKEKDYSETMFMPENYNTVEDIVASHVLSNSTKNGIDDKMLQSIYEQNTKIMDRLETLFNKQELLSSNQLQLFETVSMLSKKIEDVLIIPNECNFDAITSSLPPLSPQNSISVSNQPNIHTKSIMSTPVHSDQITNRYQFPSNNIQTNFPMNQFVHSALPVTTNNSFHPMLWCGSSSVNTTPIPVIPPTQFQLPPSFLNNQFISSSSYSTVSRPLTSTNDLPNLESLNFTPVTTVSSGMTFDRNFSANLSTSAAFDFKEFYKTTPVTEYVSSHLTPINREKVSFSPTTVSSSVSTPAVHSFQIPVPNLGSVVLSPPMQVPEECEESDDERPTVEHDPIPDFKPIIPLPDEVDVKTGEEGEEVLFESRAKLFRFADKEWKERGIGSFKILKNPSNGKVRALMRREIVHKVCLNHLLTENMNLLPMKNSDRAWNYCAPDYADGEYKIEKFCVKFKTVETANEFEKVFNKYKYANLKSSIEQAVNAANTSPISLSNTVSPQSKKSPDKPQKKVFIAPPVMKIDDKKDSITTSSLNTTQLGGFTFSTKPVVSAVSEKKEMPKAEDTKKPAFEAFKGFSLDSFARKENGSKLFSSNVTAPSVDTFPQNVAGESSPFALVKNTIAFSNLSLNSETSVFVKSKDFKGFPGAGSLLFGTSKSNDNHSVSSIGEILKNIPTKVEQKAGTSDGNRSIDGNKNESNTNADDEFVPTAEFQPVIPLPDLVEIKTGEEGLVVLYEEHCKLFRFVNDEWKERGIGKLKILQEPTEGNIRLLMRRDQVHKLCCNQRLTADHELKPLKTTEKAWTWFAQDFSEGELKNELLCVRFKTVEQAKKFQEAFNKAKSLLKSPKDNTTVSSTTSTNATLPKLSEIFKRDQNSWECKTCYVVNKNDETCCLSCSEPREGFAAVKSSQPKTTLTFGFPNTTDSSDTKSSLFSSSTDDEKQKSKAAQFKSNVGHGSSTEIYQFSNVTKTTSVATPLTFTFGNSMKSDASNTNVFNFGGAQTGTSANTSSVFKFSPAVSSQNSSTVQNEKPTFSFSNLTPTKSESGGFFFGIASTDSSMNNLMNDTSTPKKNNSGAGKSSSIFSGTVGSTLQTSNTSGAFSNFSFKLQNDNVSPVTETNLIKAGQSQDCVPLCERVPFLFKDENEIQLFKSSAEVDRLLLNEWVLRGVGEFSVLKNLESKKGRFLMLRDPGEYICLNHYISKETVFTKCDKYAWTWSAPDFSEGEVIHEQFRVTFHDRESSSNFQTALDILMNESQDGGKHSFSSASSDEIVFVSETKISKEEKDLAESLMLPTNYYAYKYSNKTCPGCVGCDEENNEKNESVETKAIDTPEISSVAKLQDLSSEVSWDITSNPISSITSSFPNKSGLIFGGSGESTSSSWMSNTNFNFESIFNKTNLFTGDASPQKNDADEESDNEKDSSVVTNDHDPHFEPIIPLPSIVETKTGEEDEIVEFCQRSKIFRYDKDKKEWKERGVGDLKVLYHPVQKSYRLLLRRDQIHKVVLNQRITSSLNLKQLSSSKNSWCWFGMNLPEESSEPVLEELAARFKNEEITNEFSQVVTKCLSLLNAEHDETSTSHNESNAESVQNDETNNDNENNDKRKNEESLDDVGNQYYEEDSYNTYNDSREYVKYDGEFYVDEQGIEDAMEEYHEDSDVVFEYPVTLQVLEDDSTVDYEGVVNIINRKSIQENNEIVVKPYVLFSTAEIPSMYEIEVDKDLSPIKEGVSVTLTTRDPSESDNKVIFHFFGEEIATDFVQIIYDMVKPSN